MTFTTLSVALYLMPPPSTIGRSFRNSAGGNNYPTHNHIININFKTIGDITHLYGAISSNVLRANSINYRENNT